MATPFPRSRPQGTQLLRARIALPVRRPPLSDAGLLIRGSRIQAIDSWRSLSRHHAGPSVDLGEVLVLPGLINAHCHLDYTHMAGMFPPPRHFTDWIKQITTAKQTWSDDEFRASWLAGARMLVRTGTTTVADIEAVPNLLPGVWGATSLRVHSFIEMTGIRSRREPRAVLKEALEHVRRLPAGRCRAWFSPHAPYSTKPELLRRCAGLSLRRTRPMPTHVAESWPEYEMFKHGRGEMFRWLQRNDRDMADCGGRTPVQHLQRHQALGPHIMAIHVNYLGRGDANLLARTGTHVVHCPSSHRYFRHRPFPYGALSRSGVNICLGTDSLASAPQTGRQPAELNLFAEMRVFAESHPRVAPGRILAMATINGAKALGQEKRLGELSPGAEADLVVLPFSGRVRGALRHVAMAQDAVRATMIGGQWILKP